MMYCLIRALLIKNTYNIGKIKTFGYFKVDNPLMSVIPLHIQTVSNSPNQVHVRAYITVVFIILNVDISLDHQDSSSYHRSF